MRRRYTLPPTWRAALLIILMTLIIAATYWTLSTPEQAL